MYCEKCNAQLPEGAAFCPSCGNPVERKPKFCSQCGRKLMEGETVCSVCDRNEVSSLKEKPSKPKITNDKKMKLVFWGLLVMLYVCTSIGRGVGDIVAVLSAPVLLVWAIVQTIRRKDAKKWWRRFGCSILLLVALIGIEEALPVLSDIWRKTDERIVGTWGATYSSVDGEVMRYDGDFRDFTLVVKKDGTAKFNIFDETLYWSFDEDGTELAQGELVDEEKQMYNFSYTRNGEEVFGCIVDGEELFITLHGDYLSEGDFSAFFKRLD